MGTVFTADERRYLADQKLGRLATVQPSGTVQNNPVGYRVNADDTIDIGGVRMAETQKYRNVASHPQVALVVDDLVSVDPWTPRCLEIRGIAEQVTGAERMWFGGDGVVVRIRPTRLLSFGINTDESIERVRSV